ncbi:hypothetical protein BKA80DRAFT_265861 [Phyllosticta citrichinensis]
MDVCTEALHACWILRFQSASTFLSEWARSVGFCWFYRQPLHSTPWLSGDATWPPLDWTGPGCLVWLRPGWADMHGMVSCRCALLPCLRVHGPDFYSLMSRAKLRGLGKGTHANSWARLDHAAPAPSTWPRRCWRLSCQGRLASASSTAVVAAPP